MHCFKHLHIQTRSKLLCFSSTVAHIIISNGLPWLLLSKLFLDAGFLRMAWKDALLRLRFQNSILLYFLLLLRPTHFFLFLSGNRLRYSRDKPGRWSVKSIQYRIIIHIFFYFSSPLARKFIEKENKFDRRILLGSLVIWVLQNWHQHYIHI